MEVTNLKKKKQAKNGRLEPLIIYCDDISKNLKTERVLAPLFYFPPWKDAPVKCWEDQHRCGHGLTVAGVQNKRLGQFYAPGV